MNNCLVKKLKSTVDNQSLPYINALKIHLLANQTLGGSVVVNYNTYLVKPDGTKSAVTADANFGSLFTQSASETIYQLLNIDKITSFVISSPNKALKISAEDLKGVKFDTFRGRCSYNSGAGVVGKLNDIGYYTSDNGHSKTYDFANCKNLTATDAEFSAFISRNKELVEFINESSGVVLDWDIIGTVSNGKLTKVQGPAKGDIYTFVQKARQEGRTTGTCDNNFLSNGSNIETFNNVALPTANYSKVTWTADTVTIKASNTPNGSDILNQTWNM